MEQSLLLLQRHAPPIGPKHPEMTKFKDQGRRVAHSRDQGPLEMEATATPRGSTMREHHTARSQQQRSPRTQSQAGLSFFTNQRWLHSHQGFQARLLKQTSPSFLNRQKSNHLYKQRSQLDSSISRMVTARLTSSR